MHRWPSLRTRALLIAFLGAFFFIPSLVSRRMTTSIASPLGACSTFEGGSSLLQTFILGNNLKVKIVPSDSELLSDAVQMKSLVFEVKSCSEFVIICLLPEDKADPALIARAVKGARTKKDIGLAEGSVAVQKAGYELGTVPPIGHLEQMPVILDIGLVNKLKDYGKFFAGGSGESGYELLISLNQILKLDYVSIEPVAKNFQQTVDYYVLLSTDGKILKSSFQDNLIAHGKETVEIRRYDKKSKTHTIITTKEKLPANTGPNLVDFGGPWLIEGYDDSSKAVSGRVTLQQYITSHQDVLIRARIEHSFSERLLDGMFIKSLIFEVKASRKCVVLVLLAEDRVDSGRVVDALSHWGAVSKADVGLASRSLALQMAGYPLGSVPPIGHRQEMVISIYA